MKHRWGEGLKALHPETRYSPRDMVGLLCVFTLNGACIYKGGLMGVGCWIV